MFKQLQSNIVGFFGLALLLACLTTTTLSAQSNPYDLTQRTDWERLNLKGKVKEMEVVSYKLYYENEDPPTPEIIYERRKYYFNPDGNLTKIEIVDSSNTVLYLASFRHDHNAYVTKYETNDYETGYHTIVEYTHDADGRIVQQLNWKNGRLNKYEMFFDSLKHLKMQISTTERDTVIAMYTHAFDEKGRIIKMDVSANKYPGLFSSQTEYKYDYAGRMIESKKTIDKKREEIERSEYNDDGRLISKTEMTSGFVKSHTEYDKNLDPILKKESHNGSFVTIYYYTYLKYANNNWIERDIKYSVHEPDYDSKKFPSTKETRTFTYY